MTRCKAFYRKVKTLDSVEEILSFCEKKDNTVYKILAHIDFMDRYFPDWLDDGCTCTFVHSLTEGTTRQLRSLEKNRPETFKRAMADIAFQAFMACKDSGCVYDTLSKIQETRSPNL